MNVLVVVLLVALVVVFAQREKNPEAARKLMIGLLVLVFAVLGLRALRGGRGGHAADQAAVRDFHGAAAYMLGEHIAHTLPEGGTLLLLQARTDAPLSRTQATGLTRGAGQAFRIVPAALPPREEDAPGGMLDGMWISPRQVEQALAAYPGAVAIVSSLGAPDFEHGTPAHGDLPPIYILDTPNPALLAPLFHQRRIAASLALRPDADWSVTPRRGMTPEEIFNLRYILMTRENYRDILRD